MADASVKAAFDGRGASTAEAEGDLLLLLRGMHAAESHFIATGHAESTFELLVEALRTATRSEHAFISRARRDDAGRDYLEPMATTLPEWLGPFKPRDDGENPADKPLDSFLALSIRSEGELVGVAAIANGPYNRATTDFLAPFLSTCAVVIERIRADEAGVEADQKLRASDARLRLAGEAAGIGAWEWNPQTDAAHFDEGCARLVGLTSEEIESCSLAWSARVHADDLPHLREALEGHLAGQPFFRSEFRSRHRDGHWVWILSVGGIIERDAEGKPLRMVGMHLDVTERKRAEEELRESTAVLQQIIDALPQRVFWKQRDTRYLGANRAFREDAGKDPIGLTDHDMPWAGEHADAFQLVDRRVIESEQAELDIIEPIRTDDGKQRWLSTCKMPLRDADGHVFGVLGTYLDVTALKENELELARARDAAEAANRAKGEFLATMSHEIRTPLNGVLGYVDLVLETKLDPEQRELVQTVKHSGVALLQVINDILDFSKLEAGKVSLDEIEYEPRDIAADALELLAAQAEERGIELALCWSREIPHTLVGDPNRLRQVLLNLLGNAVKFSQSAPVVLRAEALGNMLRIEIVDRGAGIPDAMQARLFEKFTQVDSSAARRFGGTGLGLAISRRLLEAMGGEIGFESEVGSGTTFWLTVPFGSAKDRGSRSGLPALGRRALIVDTLPEAASSMHDFLLELGIASDVAGSLTEAEERITQSATTGRYYDWVMVDWKLIDPVGETFLQRARRESAGRRCNFVLLASRRSVLELPRYRELGFDEVLMKPIVRPTQLRALLGQDASSSAADGLPASARDGASVRPPLRVLLAEDNAINQRLARIMLERASCRVDIANNGREAIEMAARVDYDVIFMDCQMPEVDGFEATAVIRSREAKHAGEHHTPIIALTANALRGDRDRCLSAGMDGYVAKPFTREDLARALDQFAA